MSDHDLLIKLAEDAAWIRKELENHLRHHFYTTTILFAVVTGFILKFIK